MSKHCAHYSRDEIEELRSPPGAALISIRDPGSGRPRLRADEWVRTLELQFHDISNPPPGGGSLWDSWGLQGYVLPDVSHAVKIARFVHKHWDHSILVHCEMGLSRSAAVCEVLVGLGWDYVATRSEGRRLANRRLVELLREEFARRA